MNYSTMALGNQWQPSDGEAEVLCLEALESTSVGHLLPGWLAGAPVESVDSEF